MRTKSVMTLLVAAAVAVTSLPVLAKDKGRSASQPARQQQMDRDRSFDRGRMQDRDRDLNPTPTRQRDQDRDRVHVQDPAQTGQHNMYGNELMSEQERKQYSEQLRNAGSDDERNRLQAEHREQMQMRAESQGIKLGPNGERPIYANQLMSEQERSQYREQLGKASTDAQRNQIRAEHRQQMRARAELQGIELEEVEAAE